MKSLNRIAIILLLAIPFLASSLSLGAEHPGYMEAPERMTTGIGKFYMDREISFVMGHRAAGWLNRPERIQEEMPDAVVENMNLEPDHLFQLLLLISEDLLWT